MAVWHDDDIVFDRGDGRFLPYTRWRLHHRRLVERTDVRKITPHQIRHINATIELRAGTNVKLISERLGHQSIKTTPDLYAPTSREDHRRAADALGDRLFGAAPGPLVGRQQQAEMHRPGRNSLTTSPTRGTESHKSSQLWAKCQGRRRSVKITSVETAVIEGNFDWVLVRIQTDTGVMGLGEAYWGAGVAELVHKAAPVLIGQDPRNIGKIFEQLVRRMSGAGSQGGATVTAISGIEIALWDLVARSLDTPISTLFGGRFREKIRIYADCHSGDDDTPESWAEKAREVKAQGFTAMKFDLDVFNPFKDKHDISEGLMAEQQHWMEPYNRTISSPEREWMVSCVAAVKEAVGSEIMLAMDLHWKYNVGDAIKLARELERFDLLWLEDPVPPENIEAHAEVQRNTKTPICTGENLYRKNQYRPLIEQQAVRIIAPDIPKMGGLLEAKKVADHADQYFIPIAPHNVASPVGTVASAHVCAAMNNFLVMEFHANDVPWWSELVEGEPVIKDGFIHLTEAPGHGLTLNESVARAHAKPGTTYFGEVV